MHRLVTRYEGDESGWRWLDNGRHTTLGVCLIQPSRLANDAVHVLFIRPSLVSFFLFHFISAHNNISKATSHSINVTYLIATEWKSDGSVQLVYHSLYLYCVQLYTTYSLCTFQVITTPLPTLHNQLTKHIP
jgi:hypothetical protein